jgi:chemotaxis methyl-accepting protein methylase
MVMEKYENDVYLQQISNILKTDVTVFEHSFLINVLWERVQTNGLSTLTEYIEFLKKKPEEVVKVRNSFFVSYSEFFRNPLLYSFLSQYLLPQQAVNLTNEVRIWSVACSCGQEAYSLAMILEDFIKLSRRDIKYRIFATDIEQRRINDSVRGVYSASSLNNVTQRQLNEWFNYNGQQYEIKPELKRNISFSVFDLLSEAHLSPPESIFGDFDIVVCSNVLFYYSTEARNLILKKISKVLKNNGLLIMGETETEIISENFGKLYNFLPIFVKQQK